MLKDHEYIGKFRLGLILPLHILNVLQFLL